MQVHLFSNNNKSNTIIYLYRKSYASEKNMTNRTCIKSLVIALAVMTVSSCAREKRLGFINENCQEIHTLFHITVANNTKTRTKTKTNTQTKAGEVDLKTSYDAVKSTASIDSKVAFGMIGTDYSSGEVLVSNIPVYEKDGVRTADLVTLTSTESMGIRAYYPYVNNVSYNKDGSCVIHFTADDVEKGPLFSDVVEMKCDQSFETVNLKFHHITNHIGFKVCDITDDEQLKGLMRVRKVIVHGMPTEGLFVVDSQESHWVPNAKREKIVFYEGDDHVEWGLDNAVYLASDSFAEESKDCNRFYIVPEELKEGKHFVEVIFDVEPFDYDGTHYRGATDMSQMIPLSGVIPDDVFELGLQYTFVLGMNLCTVYRPIEFTATVDDWEVKYNGRILDYDNE